MADLIFAALGTPLPPPPSGREQGRFKADWPSTIALLEEELDKLRARTPTLYVDVPKAAITRKGEIAGGIRVARTPGVRLEFEKRLRGKGDAWVPAVFPCATYWTAQHNVRAIALTLERLRDVARYGATGEDQQYAGFLRLPNPNAPGGINTTALALSPERAARIVVEAAAPGTTPAFSASLARALLEEGADTTEVAQMARNARVAAANTDAAATVNAAADVVLRYRGLKP